MARNRIRRQAHPSVRVEELEADLQADLPATLALNRMGGFLWDLDTDVFFLDDGGLAVFDFGPGEYDGRTSTLEKRMIPEEIADLATLVNEAFASRDSYGAYFRVRCNDGTVRWTHTQGHIERDGSGRARRVIGIVRDASAELEHLAQQATLEADRKRQTDVVQITTSALSQALTIEDVTAALTSDEILGTIGAVGVALSLVEKDRLLLVASAGLPEPLVDRMRRAARLDEALPFPEAVSTQTPRFVDRRVVQERYPLMWPYIEDTELAAAAILPLIAQAKPIGAVAICYRDKDGFSPEERNLLLALGATIAQSVQRAVLYDEEHAIAVGLQQAMLPASIPEVGGARIAARYRPARTGHQIGGDWYDVVPLPTGRVGLVVGDVQGHDVHASAVMGQLRIALRAYAAEGHPPATLMARASSFLHDLDTDRFATCVYVDLDPVTGHAQLVRAGHHGPIVMHDDGTCVRPYIAGGLPLGLPQYSSHQPYPTSHIHFEPDDTLLLCTDGLVEFHGLDIDDGVLQVENILSTGPADLDELAEHIVATVEARQGQEDDVALLLVGLTGEPGHEERRQWSCLVAHSDPQAPAHARQMLRSTLQHWGLEKHVDAVVTAANELIANAVMHTDGDAMLTARLLRKSGEDGGAPSGTPGAPAGPGASGIPAGPGASGVPDGRGGGGGERGGAGAEQRGADAEQGGTGAQLRIEVQDTSSTLPERRTPTDTSSGSRGLLIVEQLAEEWGAEPLGAGKRIWFRLPV
ncbi:SpoIIE family protein phosphatase [Streptomyces pathocidini]|uniref:SpoIIE family protein phosphatase n=1 Tax=Streptomyces pathocidini TaxID=1650571 RepID=UPI0033DA5975